MGIELKNRFNTKEFSLKTSNGHTLNCLMIFCENEKFCSSIDVEQNNLNNNNSLELNSGNNNSNPFMIFCNPNASYWEFIY